MEWTTSILQPFRNHVATTVNTFVAAFAPPRCRVCGTALLDHRNPFLCAGCIDSIPWIGPNACTGCGFPAGPYASPGNSCARCGDKDLSLTGAAAVARYRDGARSLVLCLKFRHETEIAHTMARMMAERMRTASIGPVDMLMPVALHPKRKRDRGFDQAAMLCTCLEKETTIPAVFGLLDRIRHTQPQAMLHREARLRNMDGAFAASASMSGKRVLLVDDVMTTGATMAACAKACRTAGATRVYALVFAR